jgi:hypothetical protein
MFFGSKKKNSEDGIKSSSNDGIICAMVKSAGKNVVWLASNGNPQSRTRIYKSQ